MLKKLFTAIIQKAFSLLWLVLALYVLMLTALFFLQEKMIFHPQKIAEEYASALARDNDNVQEIKMTSPDKTLLHGWFLKNAGKSRSPLIIYFGGNAEEVSYLIPEFKRLKGYSVLLMNYRGYGLSQGTPNEKNLCSDAEYIYDKFAERNDIDKNRIIVMGRSIGSGLAVHLAKTKTVQGVILVTPYDSLVSVAQKRMNYIPVSLLLRNRFDSIAAAPKIKAPLLALVAKQDEVIPSWHALKLISKWGGKTSVKVFDNANHNSIQNDDLYRESIKKFLNSLNRPLVMNNSH